MTLKFYNTKTRSKDDFAPIDPANVRMYVCGPTVYDHAHIGNARPAIVFDVLFRLLRHTYGEDHVTYARNITDIDDKIMARAARDGKTIREVTEKTTQIYLDDVAALGTLPPTLTPRATDTVAEMIVMIGTLINQGHAYEADGHVLFAVKSMEDYGKLSGRSVDDMIAGARVEVAPYKRDPMDFVLWKPSEDAEPGWESPWGRGRPGWHLECSAMIEKHLGETIDIHGGGVDLVFPHHENEVAQSTCVHHGAPLANFWLHNGFLQVEGEKMSKSLGNFHTIHELLEKWPGEALRLQMLMSHYRQPIDWTERSAKEAIGTLDSWYDLTDGVDAGEVPEGVIAALSDDLNTPGAIAELHKLKVDPAALKAGAQLLGLLGESAAEWKARGIAGADIDAGKVEALIAERIEARKAKDFAEADRLRDEIVAMGVDIMDSPEGTTWKVAK
jgi:cysteinyl-tRNA synthetase